MKNYMLNVISATYNHCVKGWKLSSEKSNNFLLWFVLQGEGRINWEKEGIKIKQGDAIIIEPDKHFVATQNINNKLSFASIHFKVFSNNQPVHKIDTIPKFTHIHNDKFFANLLDRVITAYSESNNDYANLWLQSVILEIAYNFAINNKVAINSSHASSIYNICSNIRQSPGTSHNIKEIAMQLNMTSDYFCRIFKKTIGITPKEFIINSRILHAKNLLLTTNLTFDIIADMCGYKTVQFFSRQFKAKEGITPGEFKKLKRSLYQENNI